MKKILVIAAILAGIFYFNFPAMATEIERFEGKDVFITSKLSPQYIGYRVYAGSTGTTSVYYKVTAVLPISGETAASNVLTVSEANSLISSTNSLQLVWAPVAGATSYKLYKSTSSSTTYFYLLDTTGAREYSSIDEGATTTTAYSAAARQGGNLTVENDVLVQGDLTVEGVLNPYTTGTITTDDVAAVYGVTGATGAFTAGVTAGTDFTATRNINGRDGIFTFGVAAATAVYSGAVNIQGAATLDSTLDVDGNIVAGAANYRSTFTAASGALALTGALSGESTLDIDGNEYHGAANYRSTFTASSGALAISGAITSLAGFSGTTGTFSGDVKRGAANYVSTFTASSGAEVMTGAFTSAAAITGLSLKASGAGIASYSRSKAQLDAMAPSPAQAGVQYYCNDCIDAAVCISSGTGTGAFVQISSATVHCN